MMSVVFRVAALACAFYGVAHATFGVDVSEPTSHEAFSCMKNSHHVDFVVVRVLSHFRIDSAQAVSGFLRLRKLLSGNNIGFFRLGRAPAISVRRPFAHAFCGL